MTPTLLVWLAVVVVRVTAAVFVVLAAVVLAWLYASVVFFLRKRDASSPEALDAQPLLPGEARWVVSHQGVVLDSCTNEAETGIATGWAVDHPISTWAPPGSPDAEHYRRAVEDRAVTVFRTTHKDGHGRTRHVRVALVPRSDGTVYCESWDRTADADELAATLARAELAEARVETLMRYASDEAVALYETGRAASAHQSA
jgi:hypothetical protein